MKLSALILLAAAIAPTAAKEEAVATAMSMPAEEAPGKEEAVVTDTMSTMPAEENEEKPAKDDGKEKEDDKDSKEKEPKGDEKDDGKGPKDAAVTSEESAADTNATSLDGSPASDFGANFALSAMGAAAIATGLWF